jgi:isoleucyl-tRNA synthetase
MEFLVDDVSNWYVRRSRARFYEVDASDNRAAFATLHEVLVVTCRLLAPFAPFMTDWMHRELTGDSVHLADFGGGTGTPDPALEQGMADIRRLVSLARSARESAKVNVRQPLSRLVCVVPNYKAGTFEELEPLLRVELNVKAVEFVSSSDALVRLEARPNFRALGKRFGKRTPLAARAVAALSSEALLAFEHGEAVAIAVDGESHALGAEDLDIVRRASGELVVQEDGGYVAAIDPTVTDELRAEGVARELVSRVQRMRKDLDYDVSDRVRLQVTGSPTVEAIVREHERYIAGEVLARDIVTGGDVMVPADAVQAVELLDDTVRIALTRAH